MLKKQKNNKSLTKSNSVIITPQKKFKLKQRRLRNRNHLIRIKTDHGNYRVYYDIGTRPGPIKKQKILLFVIAIYLCKVNYRRDKYHCCCLNYGHRIRRALFAKPPDTWYLSFDLKGL